jgi:hypothetical protein
MGNPGTTRGIRGTARLLSSGAMARDDLGPGSSLDRYTIVRVLGRGGMGVVYEARDAGGTSVAIKVLHPAQAHDLGLMERFRRESRAASAVVPPNVAHVLATGEENGRPFIVAELCPGGSLEARLARGPLPWREVARLGAQVARGLMAVHALGLVHRDLKPANVLLDAEGNAKLTDFGLVGRSEDSFLRDESLTKTGELVGTLAYMAPEQAEKGRLDARTDLYSLGATLHALLTGRPPFEGQGYALLKAHLMAQPRPPSAFAAGIPRALDDLVLRLLEKQPKARPASAIEVAKELEAIAAGRGRLPRVVVLAVVVLLGAVVGGVAVAVVPGHEKTAPQPPPAPATPPAPPAPRARELAARLRWEVSGRGEFTMCSFAPDGSFFVTGTKAGELELWSLRAATPPTKPLDAFGAHTSTLRCSAFTLDSQRLLTGGYDGVVAVWDVARLLHGDGMDARLCTEAVDNGVTAIAVSPDGKRVHAGVGQRLRLWKLVATGMLARDGEDRPLGNVVGSVAFIGNDRSVSSDNRGGVFIDDLALQRWVAVGETGTKLAVSLAVSPDRHTLLVAAWNGASLATVWSLDERKMLRDLPAPNDGVQAVAFSPDGTLAFTGGIDGHVTVFDPNGWSVRTRFGKGKGYTIGGFALSPDGASALVVTGEGAVQLWDLVR